MTQVKERTQVLVRITQTKQELLQADNKMFVALWERWFSFDLTVKDFESK